jgi:N-carbamoyl-L-amino-acid hydrolase
MSGIDQARLWAMLEALSGHTDPAQRWTRRSFTPLYAEGRAWIAERMRDAGLEVSMDAGGNLVGRREGRVDGRSNASAVALAPLVTGSHTDTVPQGGRYDGILGVIAGIEVARSLRDDAIELDHPLEVVDFLAEEPNKFGLSCVGSRAWAGMLDASSFTARAPDGEDFGTAFAAISGKPAGGSAADVTGARGAGSIAAFVELHIEQGPVLEEKSIPIGVVTAIVGIRRLRVRIDGRADHAGTTPMTIRRDALVGASRIVDSIHRRASAADPASGYLVATVGHLLVEPNAINAVPARVEFIVEMRSDHDALLDALQTSIDADLEKLLPPLGLEWLVSPLSRTAPTVCAAPLMEAIEAAAQDLGYRSMRMPSGAGHDAAFVSRCGPVGMIFVPCLGGRSHCAEESITPQQAADGAKVLRETLLRLDRAMGETRT